MPTYELETKTVALQVKNQERGEVEAIVASIGVVDLDGDIIARGAIKSGSKVSMSSYGHDAVFGELPVGRGVLNVENNKATFGGKVFLSTTRGREVFAVLREMGEDQQWSFGFQVLGSETPNDEQKAAGAVRILTKLDAFEVSPVLRGAGIGTATTSVKCSGCATHEAEVEREYERVRRRERQFAPLLAAMRERKFRADRALLLRQLGPTTAVRPEPARHQLATELAAWASKRWGVRTPQVKWFHRVEGLKDGHYVDGDDCIWLATHLEGWGLASIVFHECSHYGRHVRGLVNDEHEVRLDTEGLLTHYRREVA